MPHDIEASAEAATASASAAAASAGVGSEAVACGALYGQRSSPHSPGRKPHGMSHHDIELSAGAASAATAAAAGAGTTSPMGGIAEVDTTSPMWPGGW